MQVLINSHYLAHEEGTKFYEAISFWNNVANRGVVVRRWGKTTYSKGGGELKIESFGTKQSLQQGLSSIVDSKLKRGYKKAWLPDSIHDSDSEQTNYEKFTTMMKKHYAGGNEYQILSLLGDLSLTEAPPLPTDEDIIYEDAPEIERGDSWGSW